MVWWVVCLVVCGGMVGDIVGDMVGGTVDGMAQSGGDADIEQPPIDRSFVPTDRHPCMLCFCVYSR